MKSAQERQLPLLLNVVGEPNAFDKSEIANSCGSDNPNTVNDGDRAFHDWYRFVLSYPPHLVRNYFEDFGLKQGATVLDPFCGTGTTVVEAKLNGLHGVGLEANPFPHFAGSVKIQWDVNPDSYFRAAEQIAEAAGDRLARQDIVDDLNCRQHVNGVLRGLSDEASKLLIRNSISPLPLHKTLVLKDCMSEHRDTPYYAHARLALGKALVSSISNLRFGPEVGVGKAKLDAPVISAWLGEVRKMVRDLRQVQGVDYPAAQNHLADARRIGELLRPASIDAVITSPPYPNEKDYTRTTRLESVLLDFYRSTGELRGYKKTLVRSNTRSVYQDDDDDKWVANNSEIQRIATAIEQRRIELGKTSGFEKLYGRLTRLYFGGMARHLSELRRVLKPGARLAYVVGDQASYLRVLIRTGSILGEIAEELGYQLVRIDLFRTRFATATQTELREEVVVLRWPGK